jgi:hypothetical protein
MRRFDSILVLVLSAALVSASNWTSDIVECSPIKKLSNATFTACATASYKTPELTTLPNGTVVRTGGYTNMYKIMRGVRKGVKLSTLSADELRLANILDLWVKIRREENNMCKVTIASRGNITQCTSCAYCGGAKYSVNCLNINKGRNVKCESAMTGKVFFPLMEPALRVANAPSLQPPPVTKLPPKAPSAKPPTAPKAAPVTKRV